MALCSAHKPTLELPDVTIISDAVFSSQAENQLSQENEEFLGAQSICFEQLNAICHTFKRTVCIQASTTVCRLLTFHSVIKYTYF